MTCVDVNTGSLVWKYKTETEASCLLPAVENNKVYFGSHDKNFYVLNASSGTLEKKIPFDVAVCGSPALDDSCSRVWKTAMEVSSRKCCTSHGYRQGSVIFREWWLYVCGEVIFYSG
jgi:outer membrane protein assembly factor BamB